MSQATVGFLDDNGNYVPVSASNPLPTGGGIVGDYVESVNGQVGEVVLDAESVGALPDTYTPPAAPVQSVNSQTGAVVLGASDVGAAATSHTHEIADINGLQAILNDYESRIAALENPEA